jgi:hypothetical protein
VLRGNKKYRSQVVNGVSQSEAGEICGASLQMIQSNGIITPYGDLQFSGELF